MQWVDWSMIVAYVVVVTLIGFYFVRHAKNSVAEYFVAGRSLPWWVAGTSLIAASFAADTPLFVTGLIATKGIAGNWLWWNQVVAWALAIVFFARLWRRAGLITDAEFIEFRYGGRTGAFLRGFRAFYASVILSTCTIAWVMLAMQKIVNATIAAPEWANALQSHLESGLGVARGSVDVWKWTVLIGLFLISTCYTALAGFWGIVVVDLVKFVVAMVGSILFAVYALDYIGGMENLRAQLLTEFGAERSENIFSFFPAFDSPWMPVSTFAVFLSVLWWGDCNGFAAQRMFSTRTEKDSTLAAVWYSIAHFALRTWPWVIVGLVALATYPNLEDPESGYPKLMVEILPAGVRGLVVASLFAAFISTVNTHLNWNASYAVNDIYKRFIAPAASEAACVRMSRISVLLFAALAIVVAYFMTSIESGVLILFNLQVGIGMVLMLRWFWWRINAWSEISAMVASVIVTSALPLISSYFGLDWSAATRILITVLVVTPIWLIATFVTSPVDEKTLEAFYRRVHPISTFWKPIAARCPDVVHDESIRQALVGWLAGAVGVLSFSFSIGKLVLLEYGEAAWSAAVCAACGLILWIMYSRSAPAWLLPLRNSEPAGGHASRREIEVNPVVN